jgi:antitoxin MazE
VKSRIQKWGNSQGLRLSKELLADVQFEVGDSVDVAVRDRTLVITRARGERGERDLAELVARIPKGYKPDAVDWGSPVGREVW